jgi:serine/threonine protein kinase
MDFPQQFGKYTLLRRLATGGMAEIFLARQGGVGGFEKDVVVKRLLPEHAAHPDFVSMFLDEARIAAHLTHPNIAQIFDLGQEGDDYYIAMEYVRGADLRRVCSQGIAEGNYLPLHLAIRVVTEVCDALAYAHSRTDKDGQPMGIVHRDISPTNVLVTFDGGVKLVDFGIAKAANKVSVTKVGQIKGKYGYMSPEQCRGDALDARSDIFAVGINLYEITLGRRLFRGDSDVETIRAIESGAVPAPRSISPDYPATLEQIVLRALAPRPEDRFVHARDMQRALEDFLAECGLRATSGMLAEYMRQLFREQLEREGPDGSGVRALPRPPAVPAATLESNEDDVPDETLGDAAPEMLSPVESAEVLTSAQAVNDGPTTRVKLAELRDDDVVDGRRMAIARLPLVAARPKPPQIPAQLSAELSIDEIMEVPTPSIELAVEASGISGPLAELRPRMDRRDETPLAGGGAPPSSPSGAPRPVPPASPPASKPSLPAPVAAPVAAPASTVAVAAKVAAPNLAPPKAAAFAVSPVDESEIRVRPPRRYLTGLLFLLLVVTILFGIQYLFVEDGERMNARRIPTGVAAALPPVTTILGSSAPGTPEAPATAPARLGILRVESDPPGARVVVNGNMLNSVTPASVQTFAEQRSTVRVLQAGYLPWETRLDVGATGTDVRADLKKGRPELGKLIIETSPAGARVLINGAEVGVTPLTLEKVGAGVEMTMRLEKPGHHPHGVLFTLEKDEERALGVNLIADTGPRAMAVINVESIPLGATVFDAMGSEPARPLGKTGNFPLKVSRPVEGGLRLRAELNGYGTAERDLDLKMAYYTVYLRLVPPEKHYGTLSLNGAPKVMVYVGSQELGETPLRKVRVPAGELVLVMVDAATGKRSEATVKVEKNGGVERKVVLVDGVPGLQ